MFAAKDDIFCMFEGVLENLGSLRQQYGLSKTANEVILVIEAYKALRDRAPYPASFMLSHLTGSYAFVLFDKSTNSLLVASVSATHSCQIGAVILILRAVRANFFLCVCVIANFRIQMEEFHCTGESLLMAMLHSLRTLNC